MEDDQITTVTGATLQSWNSLGSGVTISSNPWTTTTWFDTGTDSQSYSAASSYSPPSSYTWLDWSETEKDGITRDQAGEHDMIGWKWIGKVMEIEDNEEMMTKPKKPTYFSTDPDMWPIKFDIAVLPDMSVLVSLSCPDYYLSETDEILSVLRKAIKKTQNTSSENTEWARYVPRDITWTTAKDFTVTCDSSGSLTAYRTSTC